MADHKDTTTPDVLVVGAGIGGLAHAVALSAKGVTVRVLERAAELGEVGAGMQIAPNCTRILDDWGLLDEVVELGVTPGNLVMLDAIDGSELTRLDLTAVRERYGYPYVVIHRSDLHATLQRAAARRGRGRHEHEGHVLRHRRGWCRRHHRPGHLLRAGRPRG